NSGSRTESSSARTRTTRRLIPTMAKFIMSIGENAYDILSNEAKNRDVTVQQLLTAVVVPDWIKQNSNGQPTGENDTNLPQPPIYGGESRKSRTLVSPVARLRH